MWNSSPEVTKYLICHTRRNNVQHDAQLRRSDRLNELYTQCSTVLDKTSKSWKKCMSVMNWIYISNTFKTFVLVYNTLAAPGICK
ncbi:hypothetical protein Mapa_007555 [Marchantia paleacea]|nr:hypothetical protein Mapa_007555 [Marchantia paleacea]